MNALIPAFIYLCIFATSYRFYACLEKTSFHAESRRCEEVVARHE